MKSNFWLATVVGFALRASIVSAQTSFDWTNTTDGAWSDAANWTPTAPAAYGATNYTLNFINSGNTYTATNDLGDFLLNQLNFANVAATLSGSPLRFIANGDILPQLLQTGASNVTISAAIVQSNHTTYSVASLLTLGGVVSGPGALIKTGDGTLLLSATNTFSGGIIVSNGILKTGSSLALGAPSGGTLLTIAPGAALDLGGVTSSGYTQTIVIAGSGVATNFGAIGNTGATLINTGVRNILLAGDAAIGNDGNRFGVNGTLDGGGFTLTKVGNDYITVATITNLTALVISNGTWSAEAATSLGAASISVAATTAIFQVWSSSGLRYTNSLTLNGGTFNSANGTNTWAGPLTLNGPTNIITVATSGATNNSLLIAGPVTGNGILLKTGTYPLYLTNANTYTGATIINAGTLVISTINNTGPNNLGYGSLIFSGGNLQFVGLSDTTTRPITNNSSVTIDVTNAATILTFAGNFISSGGGAVTKTGSGALALAGNNLFGGTITANAGTLMFNGGSVISTVATNARSINLTGTGGTTIVITNNANLRLNGLLALGSGAQTNFGNLIQSSGTLVINGNEGASLAYRAFQIGEYPSGPNTNTYTLTGGALFVTNGVTFLGWDGKGVWNMSGGLAVLQKLQTDGEIGILNFNGGELRIGGGGIANTSGINTFNLSGGTLSAYASWSSSVNLNLTNINGNLVIQTPGYDITLTGVLSGIGGFTKTGTGTLILGGNNTYSGGTVVNAGTLTINGRLANSPLTVTGGTLGGTGFVNSAIIDGGTLSPGNSVGTLTVGNLTLTNLPRLVFELGATNASDLVIVTNTLVFTSMNADWFAFVVTNGFGVGDYTLFNAAVLNGTLGADTNLTNIGGSGFSGFLWLDNANADVKLTVVPEPTAGALVGVGLVAVFLLGRVRRGRQE